MGLVLCPASHADEYLVPFDDRNVEEKTPFERVGLCWPGPETYK